jgi:hypothetical protein
MNTIDRYEEIILKVLDRHKYPLSTRQVSKMCLISPITAKNKLTNLEIKSKVRKIKLRKITYWISKKSDKNFGILESTGFLIGSVKSKRKK